MCGNPNVGPAPSSGDLIAVIHPVHSAVANCFIRLSNSYEAMTTSDFSCETSSIISANKQERVEVPIHKYGNLAYHPPAAVDLPAVRANPVIHTFFVNRNCPVSLGAVVRMLIGCKLCFGAGEDGMVGRTVSILDQEQTVIGEGIIGWG